jgi:hypothetical protein
MIENGGVELRSAMSLRPEIFLVDVATKSDRLSFTGGEFNVVVVVVRDKLFALHIIVNRWPNQTMLHTKASQFRCSVSTVSRHYCAVRVDSIFAEISLQFQ